MKINDNKNGVFKNFFWKFIERTSSQSITLIVSIILARILDPKDFGVISILMIFVSFANLLVTDGISSALIQKKEVSITDYSTLFYSNIIFSCILYILMYNIAPFISNFYSLEILTPTLRVLALQIPISSIGSIQQAYISKNMLFKKYFHASIVGSLCSAIVGIILALLGYGVWALIFQLIVKLVIDNIILWITVKWRPKLLYSFDSLKVLLRYGISILLANIIINFYNELRSIIIGKIYSPVDLAYYNRGKLFPGIIESNINTSISSVLFPVLSNSQDNPSLVKDITRKSIKIGSFMIWPIMIGLAVLAKPFVIVVLTEKWLNSVYILQIYCLIYGLMPIQTANMQAIKAMGKSSTYMKLEVYKRIVGIIVLLIFMNVSLKAIVISNLVVAVLFSIMNSYPNRRIINYNYVEQINDSLPSFINSLFMGGIVYITILIINNNFLKILIGIFVGFSYYILSSIITKNENLYYIVRIIKGSFLKNKNY